MGRPQLLPVLKGVAMLFATLVLIQAVLAGTGLFLNHDLIELHGTLGGVIVVVALAQVIVAFLLGPPPAARRMISTLVVVMLILVVIQYALGLSSRGSTSAAAWHLPLGVFIYGMIAGYSATIFRLGH
jgi:hypothetical protein